MQVVLKVVPGEDKAPLASTRAFIRALVGSKEVEWIFDPTTCEESDKGQRALRGGEVGEQAAPSQTPCRPLGLPCSVQASREASMRVMPTAS
jgi:hypothetical protein